MAKSTYIGVSSVARKVKKAYIGVSNVAKKIKKMYIGDANGKARLFWSGSPDLALLLKAGTKIYKNDSSALNSFTLNTTASNATSLIWYDPVNSRFIYGARNDANFYTMPVEGNTWTAVPLNGITFGSSVVPVGVDQDGINYRTMGSGSGRMAQFISVGSTASLANSLTADSSSNQVTIANGKYICGLSNNAATAVTYWYTSNRNTVFTQTYWSASIQGSKRSGFGNQTYVEGRCAVCYYDGYYYFSVANSNSSNQVSIEVRRSSTLTINDFQQVYSFTAGLNYSSLHNAHYYWKGKFFYVTTMAHSNSSGDIPSAGTYYLQLGSSSATLVKASSTVVYSDNAYTDDGEKIYRLCSDTNSSSGTYNLQYSIDGITWTNAYSMSLSIGQACLAASKVA